MVRCQNRNFSLFFLLFSGNKQQEFMSLSQRFIIIQSDQDLCQLTQLMDTIECISEQLNWAI